MSQKRKSSGFAVFIILLGIAIILINFGILDWKMFWGITKLWPLLLVAIGLSLLFKHIRHINLVVWLIFIGVVVGYSYLNYDDKTWFLGDPIETTAYEKEMVVEKGKLDLDVAVGEINLKANDSNTIYYDLPTTGINKHEVIQSDVLDMTIRDNSSNNLLINIESRSYKFDLPKDTSWDMNLDAGLMAGTIDLSDLIIERFVLDFATGDVEVITANEGYYKVDLAAGNVVVDVPEDLPVRVRVDDALSAFSYPDDFTSAGSYIYSPTYDENQPFVDVFIDIATGNVEIK